MPPLQFAAQSYTARSPQLINQVCVNAFVETSPKDAKTTVPIYGTPGLTLFTTLLGSSGPVFGMHVMGANLYIVSGGKLYEVLGTDVLAATPGQILPSTLIGRTGIGAVCSMADNGLQLVMVDGQGGSIYQPGGLNQVTTATAVAGDTVISANITGTITAGDTLIMLLDNGATFTTTAADTSGPFDTTITLSAALPSQITAGGVIADPSNVVAQITAQAFMAAATVGYFDGYFVFNAVGTRLFFLSAINDGTQYSGLDFATATASSSNVVGIAIYHEQLLVFTSINIEVWWDAGAVTFPFQRYDAALIARGCASAMSICAEDNTVFWMGDDGNYYRLNGFLPQRISTFAVEHAWAQYPNKFRDCSCFVLDQEGHKFVVCNFASGNETWVHDIATGLWHQRISYGSPWLVAAVNPLTASLGVWRGLSGINWLGFSLVGDAFTNVVGLSDFAVYTEYGQVMELLVTTPPLQKDRKYIFVTRFEIDMQVGDGLSSAVSGAGTVLLDVSKDGGMTWGTLLKPRSMGQVGQYKTRIRWLNLGQGRQWVFRLHISDPVRRQIIGAYWDGYSSL